MLFSFQICLSFCVSQVLNLLQYVLYTVKRGLTVFPNCVKDCFIVVLKDIYICSIKILKIYLLTLSILLPHFVSSYLILFVVSLSGCVYTEEITSFLSEKLFITTSLTYTYPFFHFEYRVWILSLIEFYLVSELAFYMLTF